MAQDFRMRRIRGKVPVDQYGSPIPCELHSIARACAPFPLVVSPAHEDSSIEVRSVEEFEFRYGRLVRSTPQYHGVPRTALRHALGNRLAIKLRAIKLR